MSGRDKRSTEPALGSRNSLQSLGAARKEDRRSILPLIDTNLKLFGLIVLAMEAAFAASLAVIPREAVTLALVIMAATFVMAMSAALWLHRIDKTASAHGGLQRSGLTVSSPLLDELVRGAIETVCRAVSLPQTPESARLRVFIFRADQSSLVCTHFWAPNPTQEQVGLRFDLRADLCSKVAVVDAAMNRCIARTQVAPIPTGTPGVQGTVDPNLAFVLAAPIIQSDNTVWGVVDFDTTTPNGQALLSNEVSDQVMYQLARHLRVIFQVDGAV